MIVQNTAIDVLSKPAEIYRLSVDQYHEMIAADVFASDDKLELLEGYLVRMSPIGPVHSSVVRRLCKLLSRRMPTGWELSVQQPITLTDSEPQPDISVIREKAEEYDLRHPGPHEVGLLIEVADSSLAQDQRTKAPIYAAAGILEYWIVNLVDRQIEVYRNPQASAVDSSMTYGPPEVIGAGGSVPFSLEGTTFGVLQVKEILP